MTQPDHPARRGPKRRNDSTHPASTRSGHRLSGDRRPYPNAPTTTRISPAKPHSVRAGSWSRGPAATPTPATVWTAGPAPIDLDTAWPAPIIRKIVSSFSEPGGQVVLLTPGDRLRPMPAGADGVSGRTPQAEPDNELADALAAVESLGRSARTVRVPVDPTATGPGARPFWADLVGAPKGSPPPVTSSSGSDLSGALFDGADSPPTDTDLVITSLRPEHGGDHAADLVALVAARLLRVGGILVVLTHCDWSGGELIDPTGAAVASAQNADLLYLQHIVALHTPVRGGRFVSEPLTDSVGAAAGDDVLARHRTAVRGLPAPHRRIHSDVLVFAQPHDYEPPRHAPADAAFDTGVIR
ncbi:MULTISPECIES: hypothetical protein [Saccharothrix]|uniref:hypothetical protein n=1 Tax=Saccharothrix TaxID=2071 RepID=UPI00093B538B|nr:hypothetical protein [Saccharothrix sp. CB00851]OKI24713.1 hypothetical protein A6A25_34475 [Saccharothrix sp. CB00851]